MKYLMFKNRVRAIVIAPWLVATVLALSGPAFCQPVSASSPKLEAELLPSEVEVGASAQLSIAIQDSSAQPQLPHVQGLSIEARGTSQQMTVINGNVSQSTTYHYAVRAPKPGTYNIAPIRVGSEQTGVRLEVRPAGALGARRASPSSSMSNTTVRSTVDMPGKRAFLRARVDRERMTVGESVPIVVRAYVQAGTSGVVTGKPELDSDGFAISGFDDEAQQGKTEIDGVPYAVLTWRGKLTALLPGEYDLSASVPATLRWRELEQQTSSGSERAFGSLFDDLMNDPFFSQAFGGRSPFSNFGSSFGSSFGSFSSMGWGPERSKEVTLKASLGAIDVREPPTQGRPEGWDGAIGRFDVSSELAPLSPAVGEPVTLTLRVSGEGNFERLHHSMLPEGTEGVRVYPAEERFEEGSSASEGQKVFTQTLVPTQEGKLELPALELVSYDPQAKRYRTVRAELPELEVRAGATAALAARLRDTKPSNPKVSKSGNTLPREPGEVSKELLPPEPSWLAIGLLTLLLGLAGFGIGRLRAAVGSGFSKRWAWRARLLEARRNMRRARRENNAEAFFVAAAQAVRIKVALRLGLYPHTLTPHDLQDASQPFPPVFAEVLSQADAISFGNGADECEELGVWLNRIETALDQPMKGVENDKN